MKALFDPLLPDKRLLAGRNPRASGGACQWKAGQDAIQARMDVITKPLKAKKKTSGDTMAAQTIRLKSMLPVSLSRD